LGLAKGQGCASESPKDQEKCRGRGWRSKSESPKGCRGWRSKCHRSESVQPRCGRLDETQSKCRRSRHPKSEIHAKWVKDVNFPDGSVIAPGITVIKQWQIKNAGSSTWPEGSKVIFLRGNRELLGEQEEFSVPVAQPGQTVDISCPITVPTKPGRYSAYFKLADKDRVVFGQRFWMEFSVAEETKNIKSAAPKPEFKKEIKEDKVEDNSKVVQGINSVIPPIPSAPTTSTVTAPVTILPALPATSTTTNVPEPSKYANALGVLERMGFVNVQLNNSLLERAQGNIEQVVTWLLEIENSIPH